MSNSEFSNSTIEDEEVVNSLRRLEKSKETVNKVISFILVNSKNVDGVMMPALGAITRAGEKFGVSKYTASRIFSPAKKTIVMSQNVPTLLVLLKKDLQRAAH
jgi:hypothetical protein